MIRRAEAASDELLADLSDAQRAAVTHTEGPLLVLAGPGSGKTRVITRRAAYLAQTVTLPHHILAITFTNKAALEMKDRMLSLGHTEGMTVSTYHAFCARLLRQYHDEAGLPANFTIFDRDDCRRVLKDAIEACSLSITNWPLGPFEQIIGRAKNAMLGPSEFASRAAGFVDRTAAPVYSTYQTLLAKMGGVDFDDLLVRAAGLLGDDADLRDRIEERYRYVLIDEYQDTNLAQYRLARLLTRMHENLCATGDPDQSIYGWRGADIENILRFEADYPSARVVRLEQNYRSTQRILSAADALIARNQRRKQKALWTENLAGCDVRVVECETGEEEGRMIARDIKEQIKTSVRPADVAVLYRKNSLSRTIEEAMIAEGIRYQVARGVEFYNRKEIKDVLAYLRVLVNPADEVALLRIINTPPRGIGETTVERLVNHARATGRRILDTLSDDETAADLGRAAARVRQFAEELAAMKPILERPAMEALEHVISHSGLRALYAHSVDEDGAASQNLDELISAASEFGIAHSDATVLDWLEHTALLSDVDGVRDDEGAVTLMTLHAAKGLEFSDVYVCGLEDGLLPFRREGEVPVDYEEERRLFFVGMTRARRRLTISLARLRSQRGRRERTTRSPFLDELPADQIEWLPRETASQRDRRDRPGPDDLGDWEVGGLVRHPLHGLGQLVTIDRGPRRTHAEIQFRDGSRRRFVLEFAELERVDFDDVE